MLRKRENDFGLLGTQAHLNRAEKRPLTPKEEFDRGFHISLFE